LSAGSGQDALGIIRKTPVDLIISDQMMPVMDGIDLLKRVKSVQEDIPFIMLTAHGSIDRAVAAIKEGAYHYLTKPFNAEELQTIIRRALDFRRLSRENKELKTYLSDLRGFRNIITQSPRMMTAIKLAVKVAQSPYTAVSIYGESGTGKELFARAIHSASGCMESRFVGVNCAGIPSGLLESELFGYVKGAFTGADRERKGKFDMARFGTMLLDEVGDMPPDLQAKLLRVLQERTYERIGSNRQIKADFRVIATTHRDLGKMVREEAFREDLFHRINIFPISLPPLRDRREDIPLLADHFLMQFRSELGKPLPGISDEAMKILENYDWPGNVRELKNCLERSAIVINQEIITPAHLILPGIPKPGEKGPVLFNEDKDMIHLCLDFKKEEFSLDAAVNQILKEVLERYGRNKAQAADVLKVNRNIFYRRKFI
jgi:DNA-binding NtrC family response regulator